LTRFGSIVAIFYGAVLALPPGITMIVWLIALPVSFIAMIILAISSRYQWWQFLLLLIPIVGVIIVIVRMLSSLEKSKRLIGMSFLVWSYPFLSIASPGIVRYVFAVIGGLIMFQFLVRDRLISQNPKRSALFMLAFPSFLLILVTAVFAPLVHGVQADHEPEHNYTDPESFNNDHGLDSYGLDGHSSILANEHTGMFGYPSQSLSHESLSSTNVDSFHFPDNPILNTVHSQFDGTHIDGNDFGQLDHRIDIRQDAITGGLQINDGLDNYQFDFDHVTNSWHGSTPLGDTSTYHDPVTGQFRLTAGEQVFKYDYKPIDGTWHGSGDAQGHVLSEDKVTGQLHVRFPEGRGEFRWDPVTNQFHGKFR